MNFHHAVSSVENARQMVPAAVTNVAIICHPYQLIIIRTDEERGKS